MTDFMRWLYASYICPQIEAGDRTGYELPFSLMTDLLDPDLQQKCSRLLEFYSAQAFLLGLRTGAGLCQFSQGSFGSTQPSI
jgi:hypothetical protein